MNKTFNTRTLLKTMVTYVVLRLVDVILLSYLVK